MTAKREPLLLRLWNQLRRKPAKQQTEPFAPGAPPVFRISPHSRASARDEILVVLDIANGRVFRAGGAGPWIWRGLAASQPLETVAADLSARTGAPLQEARLAVMQFVRRLQDLGLATAAGR